jgi:hypothetical protein
MINIVSQGIVRTCVKIFILIIKKRQLQYLSALSKEVYFFLFFWLKLFTSYPIKQIRNTT